MTFEPSNVDSFTSHRDHLFAIAYRMLGSVEDAEDVVQEAFLRWHQVNAETIESPGAWLTTVVTRIALNQLHSARATRETYIGPWLPEPLLTANGHSPSDSAELSDSLSIAFLAVLERLSPRERAVYLLRDVFGYEYDDIARMVELGEANCRQIFHRAKQRLDDRKQRFSTDPETHRALLESFARAVNEGDVDGVVELLTRDAVLWADGGGQVRAAARKPLRGALVVARFLVGVRRKVGSGDLTLRIVNGLPALITTIAGSPRRVVSIDVSNSRIAGVYVVANPDKLRPLMRSLALM
jgi:RNA polymerase sigma-70 factor (ECF subfamily)